MLPQIEETINKLASEPRTLLFLSQHLGISKKTLKKWIREFRHELGERNGYLLTPRQVRIILEKIM